MKSLNKIALSFVLSIFLLSNMRAAALAEYVPNVINIDGYYDDWEALPKVDFYNNPNMRHQVGLYRDDKFVYIYVHMAKNGHSRFNGANYNFYIDGTLINLMLTMDETPRQGKITAVTVRYQKGHTPVTSGIGRLYTPSGSGSDQCEAAIPLSAFAYDGIRKPTGIDTENISTIILQCHDLGSQTATATGTDTLPYVSMGICFAAAAGGIALYNKKRKKLK